MLQAEETWDGPNHMAASRAGTDKTKTCDKATMDCPRNASQNLSGWTAPTFIQAPAQVPTMPIKTAFLRPWEENFTYFMSIVILAFAINKNQEVTSFQQWIVKLSYNSTLRNDKLLS